MTSSVPMPFQRGFALLVSLALILAALVPLVAPRAARAAPTELFFSEYIEGSSNNKALEIYNGTGGPVDLGAYSVELYSNARTTPSATVGLTGTLADGDVFVLAHPSANADILAQSDLDNGSVVNFNGNDAVVLSRNGQPVDVIGDIGDDPSGGFWGADGTDARTSERTLVRKGTVEAGDTNGTDPFDPAVEWDGHPQNTTTFLGFHTLAGGEQPVIASCGPPLTVMEATAATRTVTASDADGVVTNISITSVDPNPGTISIGATTAATGAGGSASAVVSVGAATPVGSYAVAISATSDDPDAGTCTLTVNVQEVLRIGEVQGQTLDSEEGRSDASPLDGETVFVRGVVTEHLRQVTSSGRTNHSFFLQDSVTAADEDPLTSDGIVVFIGGFETVLRLGGGPAYRPELGDEIIIQARVDEFFNLTELVSPRFVTELVDEGDLATMIESVEADPPDVLADAYRYWERHEGMYLTVPAGSVVTGARDVFASTLDGEVWVIRGDHPLAQREDPYARRVFRDPHPLDDVGPAGSFDNGNGMRILLLSHGLKAKEGSNEALIAPARTFDTVTNAVSGGVFFSFGKYGIEVTDQLALEPGVDPSLNAPPPPHDTHVEYATAPYNVENLYDFRDDPFDGCDFAGNEGCPGVEPPFDYVPASEADYQAHIGALADQILNDLHAPDILLIQEAEDQDICAVVAGALDCDDGVDDRDGKPDTLQELGLAIAALGGPMYDAAYDRDGADDRGIVSGFLYRTDRVELLQADASHAVLGSDPQIEYAGAGLEYNADVSNPKALNAELPEGVEVGDSCDVEGVDCVFTRDPQVGHFRVWRDGIGTSVFTDLYAISNHFSSTPDSRVEQRTEQAAYNAAIAEALGTTDDGARVVVGGDFNVFPRPDDPFPPPNTSDQLAALYELGLHSLWEVVVAEAPASAYSYVFEGQAQTLDNQFVTDVLLDELNGVRYAHVNADWPAAFDGDGSRGASDHDPQVARFDAVTGDAFGNLVDFYVDSGQIDVPGIGEAIKDRLASVLDKLDDDDTGRAAEQQLARLVAYLEQHAPDHIDPEALETLLDELELLVAG